MNKYSEETLKKAKEHKLHPNFFHYGEMQEKDRRKKIKELEQHILEYLNARIEDYGITDEALRSQFFSIPQYIYDGAIKSLEEKNCIGYKITSGKGRTITPDGQKELNANIILATTKTGWDWVKALGIVVSVATISQAIIMCNQNYLLNKQLKLEERQLLIDSLSKTKWQLVRDTIYITKSDTSKTKN